MMMTIIRDFVIRGSGLSVLRVVNRLCYTTVVIYVMLIPSINPRPVKNEVWYLILKMFLDSECQSHGMTFD